MGSLRYGDEEFAFTDRVLAHLQIVVGSKLRRRETFFLSWKAPVKSSSGRHAVWIDNGIAVHFQYDGTRVPTIDRDWVERMMQGANSSAGLFVDPDGENIVMTPPRPGS